MTNKSGLLILMVTYVLFTPAFQCGDRYINECTTYKNDTAISNIQALNFPRILRVNDTLKLTSIISDTVHTISGTNYIPRNLTTSRYIQFQVYKVVMVNGNPVLNFANIEFNPLVTEGSFPNYGGGGIFTLYSRVAPYNRLAISLVSGQPGLYLLTAVSSGNNYGYSANPAEPCTNYQDLHFFPVPQQQKQYWDTLAVTKLRLNGSNDYVVKSKEDPDYMFFRINP